MTCHSTANPGRPRDNRGRYLKLPPVPSGETFNDNPGPTPADNREDDIRLMIIVSLAVTLALCVAALVAKVALGGAA